MVFCSINLFSLTEKNMLQQFKTNIHCGSCIRSVTGFLDEVPGVTFWRVDTEDPRKVLSVEGSVSAAAVIAAVEEAGFDISPLEELEA